MRLWTNRSNCSGCLAVGLAVGLAFSAAQASAQDVAAEAWRLEKSGDGEQALGTLRQATVATPNDPVALRAYAEFLERHHDPAAREAYTRLSQLLQRTNGSTEQRAAVAQRLAVLDLLAGDRDWEQTPGLRSGAALRPRESGFRACRQALHRGRRWDH